LHRYQYQPTYQVGTGLLSEDKNCSTSTNIHRDRLLPCTRMVQFLSFFCVALMVLETSTRCQSFSLTPRLSAVRRLKSSNTLSMSSNTLSNLLGLMPLCLTATSKTTTTNDPTAGMSPEEIVNYISNVGGGMCGYPEWVRGSIGVGLNLSLLAFGLATVSYG
jgi:hypothetical protein